MRVALCQTNSDEDVRANTEQVERLLADAADAGADLAALPEVWPCQGSSPQMRAAAEPVPGPRTERLAAIARERRMWIHGGSVLELDEGRVFNTSVLFDRDGEPLDLAFPDDRELDYLSPAFNAVTAMRYGRTAEFDVWFFDPVTIEPRAMRQRYEHRGEEDVETAAGRFRAVRWGYEALDTGYASEFWTAAEVVVRYTGYLELETYEPGASGVTPTA